MAAVLHVDVEINTNASALNRSGGTYASTKLATVLIRARQPAAAAVQVITASVNAVPAAVPRVWVRDPVTVIVAASPSPQLSGDLNGDGYADVGFPGHSDVQPNLTQMFGTTGAIDSNWRADALPPGQGQMSSEAAVADFNADGFDDVVVGIRAGSTFSLGLARGNGGSPQFDGVSVYPLEGVALSPGSVQSVLDANGDGYADVVAGVQLADGSRRVLWFGGSVSGLIAHSAVSDQSEDVGGAAGDVNADGYFDLITIAPTRSPGQSVRVYLGGPEGFSAGRMISLPLPGSATERVGVSAMGVGDVTGDGIDDIAIAFPAAPDGPLGVAGDGQIWIYAGDSTRPLVAAPIELTTQSHGTHLGGLLVDNRNPRAAPTTIHVRRSYLIIGCRGLAQARSQERVRGHRMV